MSLYSLIQETNLSLFSYRYSILICYYNHTDMFLDTTIFSVTIFWLIQQTTTLIFLLIQQSYITILQLIQQIITSLYPIDTTSYYILTTPLCNNKLLRYYILLIQQATMLLHSYWYSKLLCYHATINTTILSYYTRLNTASSYPNILL